MPYSTVPFALVSTLLDQYPATREELHAIRDPRQPHRFQGVYSHRHGGATRGDSRYVVNAYRARVFKFWELGSNFESPELAARSVVAFYKAHFGDHWRTAFRYRKVIPWRIRQVFRPNAGFAVDLFVRGKPFGITRADAGEGRSVEWVWPTPEAAKLAARESMRRKFERERSSLPIPAPGLLFWRA
jgi:hypothetical protein